MEEMRLLHSLQSNDLLQLLELTVALLQFDDKLGLVQHDTELEKIRPIFSLYECLLKSD